MGRKKNETHLQKQTNKGEISTFTVSPPKTLHQSFKIACMLNQKKMKDVHKELIQKYVCDNQQKLNQLNFIIRFFLKF